MKSYLHL